jgi:hypothetical protein
VAAAQAEPVLIRRNNNKGKGRSRVCRFEQTLPDVYSKTIDAGLVSTGAASGRVERQQPQ